MTLFDTTELRRPTQRKLHAAWWEITGEKMYLTATTATELAPLAAAPTSGPNGLSAAEDELERLGTQMSDERRDQSCATRPRESSTRRDRLSHRGRRHHGRRCRGLRPAAGQPMVLFEEFTGAMTAALAHPEMVAGLARRGLTSGDVFCLPLTAGNYLTPEYEGTRLMKVPCYLNPTGSNYYAKPIEGLFAVVDLLAGEATRVVDEGVVPLPEDDWATRRTRSPPARRCARLPARCV